MQTRAKLRFLLQHRARHLCSKVLQNAVIAYAVLNAELLQCAATVSI